MNLVIELIISFQEQTKLIIYEKDTPLSNFLQLLQGEFQIDKPIKLIDLESNGEITTNKSFRDQRKLSISFDDTILVQNVNEPIPEQPQSSSNETLLHDIVSKKFLAKDLISEVTEWGYEQKIKLIRSEGTKLKNNTFIKVMICAERQCKFRLTFKSDTQDGIYQLDENLAKKRNNHSKFTFIPLCLIFCRS